MKNWRSILAFQEIPIYNDYNQLDEYRNNTPRGVSFTRDPDYSEEERRYSMNYSENNYGYVQTHAHSYREAYYKFSNNEFEWGESTSSDNFELDFSSLVSF